MPKNIVQDVVPPNRKSIRNITLSRPEPEESNREEEREPFRSEGAFNNREFNVSPSIGFLNSASRSRGKPSFNTPKLLIWTIGIISTLFVIWALGNIFSSAELNLTTKTQTVSINLNLVAKPKVSNDGLSYTSVVIEREKEISVPADSEKSVETPAAGKIIIYNNFSTASQRLVKNTRFETPDGLIYKIRESITVPGKSNIQGKMIPGSILATVYAQSPGEEYNIGLTDFTVPGFKSSPERFAGFYARSKTPMTGGMVGVIKSISDSKRIESKARMEAELKLELLAEARKQAPENSIFYDDAYRVSFEDVAVPGVTSGESVKMKERAILTAFFLTTGELGRAIASSSISIYNGVPVTLANGDKLSFNFINKNDYGATSVGPIKLNLKGKAKLVWQFDDSKLKNDLLGKKKDAFGEVISKYPQITKASFLIRPIWKASFPTSESKIRIVTEDRTE